MQLCPGVNAQVLGEIGHVCHLEINSLSLQDIKLFVKLHLRQAIRSADIRKFGKSLDVVHSSGLRILRSDHNDDTNGNFLIYNGLHKFSIEQTSMADGFGEVKFYAFLDRGVLSLLRSEK